MTFMEFATCCLFDRVREAICEDPFHFKIPHDKLAGVGNGIDVEKPERLYPDWRKLRAQCDYANSNWLDADVLLLCIP